VSVNAITPDQQLNIESTRVTSEQHAAMLALAERVAGLGHWLIDLRQSTVFWSDEIYRIHGVSPEEYTPELDSAIAFYHPDDVDYVNRTVEQAIQRQEPFEFECRIIRQSGDVRIVHSRSFVQVGEDGESEAIFGIFQDVTERRESEREFAALNERYQVALSGSEAGIWDVDLRSGRVYCSGGLLKLIGVSDPGFRPTIKYFLRRLHATERARIRRQIFQCIRTGKRFDLDFRLQQPDGFYTWLNVSGQVVSEQDDPFLRMAGSAFEINDRKRDEQMRDEVFQLLTTEAPDSNHRVQRLLEIGLRYLDMDIGIVSRIHGNDYEALYVVDSLGNLEAGSMFKVDDTYCFHTLRRDGITSYSDVGRSDIAGHPCYQNFQLESYIGAAIRIEGALFGTLNFSSPHKRGRPFGLREESFVAMLSQWIAYEVGRQRNLDELFQSRESLQRKERELDLIFHAVPVNIWFKDDNNQILRMNRTAAESMGLRLEDCEFPIDSNTVFPEMAERYLEDDRKVIASGEPHLNIVEEYTPAHGKRGWVRTDKVPFDDPSSAKKRLIAVASDITESVEAQRALEEQAGLLKKLNQDLDDFAYVASHDLRAPMRGIDCLATWIEEDLGDAAPEDVKSNLRLMRQRIDRMDRMLNDILEYSRAGKESARTEVVHSAELIDEIVDWLDVGDKIEFLVQEGLPCVCVPRTSLQQIFLNLIGNAIKHHDREKGEIRISCEIADDYLTFEVADDGPGIAPRYCERIFRMFETLARRDDLESSGVGLAIVDRLVRSLGGMVWLEDTGEERGCRFRFSLPGLLRSAEIDVA